MTAPSGATTIRGDLPLWSLGDSVLTSPHATAGVGAIVTIVAATMIAAAHRVESRILTSLVT